MEYYRAVVDLNREPDDIAPKNPDGVVKSHTCYNVVAYKPSCLPEEALKEILLDRFYFPNHEKLQACLRRSDTKMDVDYHSMAAVSPPIESDAGTPRPLICLGNLGDANGELGFPHNRITYPPGILGFMRDEFARFFQHKDNDRIADLSTKVWEVLEATVGSL